MGCVYRKAAPAFKCAARLGQETCLGGSLVFGEGEHSVDCRLAECLCRLSSQAIRQLVCQ